MGTLKENLEQIKEYIRSFADVIEIHGETIEDTEKGQFEIIDIRTDDRVDNGFWHYMHNTDFEENQFIDFISEVFLIDRDFIDYNLYDIDAYPDGTRSYDFKIYID
jgi:hypothetical protein